MIIETGSAEEARQIARRLLEAARHPSEVRTVHRGTRLAFSVPDDLGRAVGREPDAHPEAETTPAAADRPTEPDPQQQEQQPAPAEFVEPAPEPAPKKRGRRAH